MQKNQSNLQAAETHQPVDIGMVLIGRFDAVVRDALIATQEHLSVLLKQKFPGFEWRLRLVQREDVPLNTRQEPSALLRDGSELREAESWDFALLFTSVDLIARYKNVSLAAISSALDLAVISTNRLDPHLNDSDIKDSDRQKILSTRLTALCTRALGHLNGLGTVESSNNLMCEALMPADLDTDSLSLNESQGESMLQNLRFIADPRLEETTKPGEVSKLKFYLRSAWINRHEILDAVVHAKPWEFPIRLLRLSAAAFSALILLIITAEIWHLASVQALSQLVVLLTLVLAAATAFVTVRQNLVIRRLAHQVTEQTVISNVAAVLIVLFGLMTSTVVFVASALSLSALFYPEPLVAAWIASDIAEVSYHHYLQTGILVTTLALLIGALGASFEDHHYFRHVVYVDEEI